jgi:hypothetical protein
MGKGDTNYTNFHEADKGCTQFYGRGEEGWKTGIEQKQMEGTENWAAHYTYFTEETDRHEWPTHEPIKGTQNY